MRTFFLAFILFFSSLKTLLASEFLPAQEAFKFLVQKDEQGLYLNIDLAPDIFLYKDRLKIYLCNQDITSSLNHPEAHNIDGDLVYNKSLSFSLPDFVVDGKKMIDVIYQGCSLKGLCYPFMHAKLDALSLELVSHEQGSVEKYEQESGMKTEAKTKPKIANQSEPKSQPSYSDELSLFSSNIFIVLASFFGLGLLLAFTPCVLPMLPILWAILLSGNKEHSRKKAFMLSSSYVLGTSLSYTAFGLIAALFGENIQAFLQHPSVIICFSFIFILLALSMFGAFSFQMPLFVQNALNAKTKSLSGLFGAFILGALSALIAGPCVAAPLAAALLYIAQTGDAALGASSLFALSLGSGLPLIMLSMGFFSIKAGAWLEHVKQLFGFLLLALALYFLSRVLPESAIDACFALLLATFSLFLLRILLKTQRALAFYLLGLALAASLFASFAFAQNALEITSTKAPQSSNFYNIQSQAQYEELIKDEALIFISASWCASCKPLKARLAKEKLDIYVLDLSQSEEWEKQILKELKIFGPPSILYFKNSKIIHKALDSSSLEQLLSHI